MASVASAGTLLALLMLQTTQTQASGTCSARSGPATTPVVELYTSEGCSSCPPADAWLSRLKADPGVVALAFHVDYWDRLGWKDRFASAAYTQRQAQSQRSSGARFSYTPQVIVDGADRPAWSRASPPSSANGRPAASVDVSLSRDGNRFSASVAAAPGAPVRLAAYWAVTEQGHVSQVKAGENDGATLKHDYVVREYKVVEAWRAAPNSPTQLAFESTLAADAAHARSVNLVIIDADSGRPVQALKLGC
ncbi:MAG: DUF1223 domain-containing protein [Burkholderiales bacterium]|nr:DUF1223 domain-containing protein [Burkholderiales bacterium]